MFVENLLIKEFILENDILLQKYLKEYVKGMISINIYTAAFLHIYLHDLATAG